MSTRMKRAIALTVLVCLLLGLLVAGCTSKPEEGEVLPLTPPLEKGNPKLDSHLNQLIWAERQGVAESFARQRDIQLVDGNVRVIIECMPRQVEAATEAANALGTVELRYRNWVQAVVPITSLTALAEAESIHFVRLPWWSAEETGESLGYTAR